MLSYINWEKEVGADITSDYYIWLTDGMEDLDQEGLLSFLFHVEYTYLIPNDRHRELDGLNLRREYCEEEEVRGEPMDYIPCSVLEMMLALAKRIEVDVLDEPNLNLFYRMLDNLSLTSTRSDQWESIIFLWLERRFSREGVGSPFPLNRSYCDERREELWSQCMHWLEEFIYS